MDNKHAPSTEERVTPGAPAVATVASAVAKSDLTESNSESDPDSDSSAKTEKKTEKTTKHKVDKHKAKLGMGKGRRRKRKAVRSEWVAEDKKARKQLAATNKKETPEKRYKVPYNVSPDAVVACKPGQSQEDAFRERDAMLELRRATEQKRKVATVKAANAATVATAAAKAADAATAAETAMSIAEAAVTAAATAAAAAAASSSSSSANTVPSKGKKSKPSSKSKVMRRAPPSAEHVHKFASGDHEEHTKALTTRYESPLSDPTITFDLPESDVTAVRRMQDLFADIHGIGSDLCAMAHTGQHATQFGSANRLGRYPEEMAKTSIGLVNDLLEELGHKRDDLRKLVFPSSAGKNRAKTEKKKSKPPTVTYLLSSPSSSSSSSSSSSWLHTVNRETGLTASTSEEDEKDDDTVAAAAGAPVATPLTGDRLAMLGTVAASAEDLVKEFGSQILNSQPTAT